MNGKVTRIDLSAEPEGSRTDWTRLRALTDDEIEAAVAEDPDAYLFGEHELLGRKGASYRYEIHRDSGGEWRWRLLSANGEVLAIGAQAFPSRKKLRAAISALRDALLGAQSEAA